MAFTYDLSSSDTDVKNISRVRLELGDITENAGVRPDGSNLQDEEILLWLGEESNDIQATVARATSALANMWTNVANITVGPRSEQLGQIADGWEKRTEQNAPATGAEYRARIRRVKHVHDPYTTFPGDKPGL